MHPACALYVLWRVTDNVKVFLNRAFSSRIVRLHISIVNQAWYTNCLHLRPSNSLLTSSSFFVFVLQLGWHLYITVFIPLDFVCLHMWTVYMQADFSALRDSRHWWWCIYVVTNQKAFLVCFSVSLVHFVYCHFSNCIMLWKKLIILTVSRCSVDSGCFFPPSVV